MTVSSILSETLFETGEKARFWRVPVPGNILLIFAILCGRAESYEIRSQPSGRSRRKREERQAYFIPWTVITAENADDLLKHQKELISGS